MFNPLNYIQFFSKSEIVQNIIYSVLVPLGLVDFTLQTFLVIFLFQQRLSLARGHLSRIPCNGTVLLTFFLFRALILLVASKYCELDILGLKSLTNQIPPLFFQLIFYSNFFVVTIISILSFTSCLLGLINLRGQGSFETSVSRTEAGTSNIPIVAIVMPIYNEDTEVFLEAVQSAVSCNYVEEKTHLFISFDEAEETELYLLAMKHLLLQQTATVKGALNNLCDSSGQIYPTRVDCVINKIRVTISRFPHSGKHATQARTFTIINDLYGKFADNVFVLFVDSDIILEKGTIFNFVTASLNDPNLKAVTGLITCADSTREYCKCENTREDNKCKNMGEGKKFQNCSRRGKPNCYQHLQDCEYIQGQMFSRAMEGILGAVTCLPGALSFIKLNALQEVAPKYFKNKEHLNRSQDFHRYFLGEDRYLTWLLMRGAGKHQISFACIAQCSTEAPDSFRKLLQQRRRWFLGGISNDIAMLECASMWWKYPGVMILKFHNYSFRGTDWLYWIFLLNLMVVRQGETEMAGKEFFHDGYLYAVFTLTGLHLAGLFAIAVLLNKPRIIFSSILIHFLCPIFNLIVTIYSLWTWKRRTWGGPRTDKLSIV
ncbi:unnamed protein product [Allacma fusca]|uniref:Chitin synthase n=1 Tax=Allacma fusca TaxID=39272 RepID=A0A8J2NKZ6_9HEXA|nr:unnamed protein product [Allacma fusca]